MRTDKQTYRIFRAHPPWIFELTGLPSPGQSTFQTLGLKALERRADGVILPDDLDQAITVVEFQFQWDDGIYARIVGEMALVQEANGWRDIQGVILFKDCSIDPKTSPWNAIVHAFYLDELLKKLEQRSPHHPLVAVFKPVIDDESTLAENAHQYYRDINGSPLNAASKADLADILYQLAVATFQAHDAKGD